MFKPLKTSHKTEELFYLQEGVRHEDGDEDEENFKAINVHLDRSLCSLKVQNLLVSASYLLLFHSKLMT